MWRETAAATRTAPRPRSSHASQALANACAVPCRVQVMTVAAQLGLDEFDEALVADLMAYAAEKAGRELPRGGQALDQPAFERLADAVFGA